MTIIKAIEDHAKHQPLAMAIVDENIILNWRQFTGRIAKLASGLRSMGVQRGDRIATLTANSYQNIEFTYAAHWLGAVIVPINIRWSESEIKYALEDSSTKILLVDKENSIKIFNENLSGLGLVSYDDLSGVNYFSYEDLIGNAISIDRVDVQSEELASIFYTGGTTGRSKGVMLSHYNHYQHSLLLIADAGLRGDGGYLHAAPMFHIADSFFTHIYSLLGGAHYVLRKFSPAAIASLLETHSVSTTILVPTMIQMILADQAAADITFNKLNQLFYGASPMPEVVLEKLVNNYPSLSLFQVYGQTESSPVLTMLKPNCHASDYVDISVRRSAGRPILGTSVEIMSEDGTLLDSGNVGEIVAKGEQVMSGYLGLEKETNSALKDGWLHTGDSGFKDENGFVYVVDRIKDMIISGGENVYSVEVENALYELPWVEQCCVVGLPDDKWGERVHAVVVPKPNSVVDREALFSHCKSRLADYKCPRSLTIRDEALPLSGAGKILKRNIRAELSPA